MSHVGLLTLSIIFYSSNLVASEVYYITTTSTDLCTVQPCLTLLQFAANLDHYLHSNTTLVFFTGTHKLSTVNLTLSNVDNFVMKSDNSTAKIKCISYSSIHFSRSEYIHITNLEFIGCGGNQFERVERLVVQDTTFKGQENSGTALELIETTAQIVSSAFASNRKGSYKICATYLSDFSCLSDGFVGGAIIATNSTIDISQSKFEYNSAVRGGAIFAEQHSIINMSGNVFIKNDAIKRGGVLYSSISTITIEASRFHNNSASFAGGVLCLRMGSNIKLGTSEFHGNSAFGGGGVLYSHNVTINIEESEFQHNSAPNGGVLHFDFSQITIETSVFYDNSATNIGGVLYSSFRNTITIGGSNFTKNCSPRGAVIYASDESTIQFHNHLLIDDNWVDRYAVIYLSDSEFIGNLSENITFSNNLGSLVAVNSNITFMGYARFVTNQPPQTTTDDFQEGGAITLLQSNVFFDGTCMLEHNHAKNGGAIHSTESKLYVTGNVTIAHNTATRNGGGVYLSATSELNCQQKSTFVLFNDTAVQKGGGLHAISSSIKATSTVTTSGQYAGARINFIRNIAKRGGGLSLEANAKFHILKRDYTTENFNDADNTNTTIFTANKADYGGAVYVDDDTNSGTCGSDPKTECFFQVLAIYRRGSKKLTTQSIHFSQNYANISGSTLYGGLLDRCAVSQFAEVYKKFTSYDYQNRDGGIAYFINVSIPTYYMYKSINIKEILIDANISVSSRPVRMCLCIKNEFDDYTHLNHIEVKKGQTFMHAVVAIDQVGQPVSATIQTTLNFAESGLAEGQLARKIPAECTNLTFNVVSPHNSEKLTLYASDGPCRDVDQSKKTIDINFLPCSCPIGLQVSVKNDTNCTRECHSDINQYVKACDVYTGSFVKQPQPRTWISYTPVNDSNLIGYLVYPNCPFDYCLTTSPPVDLNQPNGADAQCAFNRSSLLCGSCQPGLSLSLGSSRCLPCPSYWPALLIAITIAAILAGVALVTILLVLNMTVAVGTLNGLIFYANVVYVNKSILLPFQETQFITVFISWLNLELGIDTCYFSGMDTYTKTWLELAFPAYVILLVVLVIIISSYSSKFSNLIGKKDPVATLATLILLSYAKLLEICFKSLSVGILRYPSGSSERLWLPDANVKYLSGNHIPLFIAAVLILLVGLVYTAVLFLWQWLLYLPRWKIFRWSRNPKIQTFIETYHTPYTPKHRYWTGLLLIVRIVLYFVSAVNASNDPTVALTAINFTVCFIVLLKGFIGSKTYRKWPVDILETFFYLNILFLLTFTWYSLDKPNYNQEAAAYTSVIIAFIVLVLIILYHVYTYTTVFSKIKKTKPGKMIDRLFTDTNPKLKPKHHWSPPPDDDIHRFNELLDMIDRPVNTNDYKVPLKQKPVKPTQSVVEVHQPYLTPPDPEEAINTQRAAEAVQVGVN